MLHICATGQTCCALVYSVGLLEVNCGDWIVSLFSRLIITIALLTLACGGIEWYQHGFLEGVKIVVTLVILIVATFFVSLWISKGD